MLPRLFFVHFRQTSFIAEEKSQIVGFLIGFFSQTISDEGYIHFVGVHPDHRRQGVARVLYGRFFETMLENHRNIVRCVTAPINKNSIAFHSWMGFQIEPQESQVEGIAFHPNYDGVNEDRVLFVKHLSWVSSSPG